PKVAIATVAVNLYREVRGKEPESVAVSFPFRSGDRIRFGVTSSQDGELILLMKGASGRLQVLYPDKRLQGGAHGIKAGEEVRIPADSWFAFDQHKGEETIWALFAAEKDPLLGKVEAATASAGSSASDLEKEVEGQLSARARDLVLTE